jgi:hypothetical protein
MGLHAKLSRIPMQYVGGVSTKTFVMDGLTGRKEYVSSWKGRGMGTHKLLN